MQKPLEVYDELFRASLVEKEESFLSTFINDVELIINNPGYRQDIVNGEEMTICNSCGTQTPGWYNSPSMVLHKPGNCKTRIGFLCEERVRSVLKDKNSLRKAILNGF